MIEPILAELEQEAKSTRKMLEVLPEDKLPYRPHEKSMTLGRLAWHLAEIPGWADSLINQDEIDLDKGSYKPVEAKNISEVLDKFDKSVAAAVAVLQDVSDEHLLAAWKLKKQDTVLVEMPRFAVIRTWLLNHLIHHRGQLSVYLRLNGVALPQIYGPTADEDF